MTVGEVVTEMQYQFRQDGIANLPQLQLWEIEIMTLPRAQAPHQLCVLWHISNYKTHNSDSGSG